VITLTATLELCQLPLYTRPKAPLHNNDKERNAGERQAGARCQELDSYDSSKRGDACTCASAARGATSPQHECSDSWRTHVPTSGPKVRSCRVSGRSCRHARHTQEGQSQAQAQATQPALQETLQHQHGSSKATPPETPSGLLQAGVEGRCKGRSKDRLAFTKHSSQKASATCQVKGGAGGKGEL
jgi:hypothetical protein